MKLTVERPNLPWRLQYMKMKEESPPLEEMLSKYVNGFKECDINRFSTQYIPTVYKVC